MFNPITPLFAPRGHAQALAAWRESAEMVRLRWRAFVEAGAEHRSRTFAAYLAALDAEEAAAAEVAALAPSRLAA
jgi:hypothetical protein